MADVKKLGQVFTPPSVVEKMLALRKNCGRVLYPSCGDGAFSNCLYGCVAIELDATKAPANALVTDFFGDSTDHLFKTVIFEAFASEKVIDC